MYWLQRTRGLALLGLMTGAGCAGNGQGLDQNGRPRGSDGSSGRPLTADLHAIQDSIFTPIRKRSRIGPSAPDGVRRDAADSFNLLTGIPSAEVPNVLQAMLGEPGNSFLISKLESSAGIVGAQMPFGGAYLPQASTDVIRQWVTNCAQMPQTVSAAWIRALRRWAARR